MNKQAFIDRVLAAANTTMGANEEAGNVAAQYTALDMGNTLTDEDFTGRSVTKAELVAMIVSLEAISSLIATGHATNLYKAK